MPESIPDAEVGKSDVVELTLESTSAGFPEETAHQHPSPLMAAIREHSKGEDPLSVEEQTLTSTSAGFPEETAHRKPSPLMAAIRKHSKGEDLLSVEEQALKSTSAGFPKETAHRKPSPLMAAIQDNSKGEDSGQEDGPTPGPETITRLPKKIEPVAVSPTPKAGGASSSMSSSRFSKAMAKRASLRAAETPAAAAAVAAPAASLTQPTEVAPAGAENQGHPTMPVLTVVDEGKPVIPRKNNSSWTQSRFARSMANRVSVRAAARSESCASASSSPAATADDKLGGVTSSESPANVTSRNEACVDAPEGSPSRNNTGAGHAEAFDTFEDNLHAVTNSTSCQVTQEIGEKSVVNDTDVRANEMSSESCARDKLDDAQASTTNKPDSPIQFSQSGDRRQTTAVETDSTGNAGSAKPRSMTHDVVHDESRGDVDVFAWREVVEVR